MIRRWHGGFVHRIRRVRKIAWSPIRRAARDTARASAARIGSTLLPPWRCPGCGSWRQRRRLARCAGVVAASPLRQQVFANGCPHCGLIYAAPRPAADQLESMYAETGEWATSHPGGREVPRIGRQLLRAVDERTGICAPVERSQVLDFGCGHGRWLNALAKCGWDTFGIDPSTKTAFARHTELAAVPGSPRFQLVIASHVLEHVPDPGEVLNALGRATLPGGWIFVSVPNLDRLPDHREWRYVLNARAHMAAYSFDCLQVLLDRAGFGDVTLVTLPRETRKGLKRLRVVARRGAPARPPARPLEAALEAMRRAAVIGVRPQGHVPGRIL